MRISDRGSAVVEFLLLILPLGLVWSATTQVVWFAYAKTQARIIATVSAFALAQPDSEMDEVSNSARVELVHRLGDGTYRLENFSGNGLSEVVLAVKFPQPLGLAIFGAPEIKVRTHSANEI